MTYCVGLKLNEGLVMLSDSLSNAGIDNIARCKKLYTWEVPGERAIAMLTAGNLSVTQAVMIGLQEAIDHPKDGCATLYTASSMFEVAELVGDAMGAVQQRYAAGLKLMGESSLASIIVGGQRKGGSLRLFNVYAAGNFVETTLDTPFFQIGEHKYGKPILDRTIAAATPLDLGVTAALLSMDSTLRSNLTVGMPLDLCVLRADEFAFTANRRIEENDVKFAALSSAWSQALLDSFEKMPQNWF